MRHFIRPFRPEDLEELELQDVQKGEIEAIGEPLVLLSGGEAWSMIEGVRGERTTQRVRACAGLIYFSMTRARAWSLMGRNLTRREWGFAAQRMGARLTELQEFRNLKRVEAETKVDFGPGYKLLLHLGFRFECVQPAAGPNGEAHVLFARLRDLPDMPALRRYEAVRKLAFNLVVEDVIEKRHLQRRAA